MHARAGLKDAVLGVTEVQCLAETEQRRLLP